MQEIFHRNNMHKLIIVTLTSTMKSWKFNTFEGGAIAEGNWVKSKLSSIVIEMSPKTIVFMLFGKFTLFFFFIFLIFLIQFSLAVCNIVFSFAGRKDNTFATQGQHFRYETFARKDTISDECQTVSYGSSVRWCKFLPI